MKRILTVLVISCMILGVISTAVSADAPAGSVKLVPGDGITVTGEYGQYWSGPPERAFDGEEGTFTDIGKADTDIRPWVGLSLDQPYQITYIRYLPRNGNTERSNAVFQGANNSDFSDAVNLYVTPYAYEGDWSVVRENTPYKWYEVPVTDTGKYKYVRAYMPVNNDCNFSEIEFYTGGGADPAIPLAWNSDGSVTITGLSYPAALIVASYNTSSDGKKILDGTFTKQITADGTIDDSALLALAASGGNVKAMLWDSMELRTPLIEAVNK